MLSGRKSGAALRVLRAGFGYRGPRPWPRPALRAWLIAQPVAGLAQSAEREQMESGNRRGRRRGLPHAGRASPRPGRYRSTAGRSGRSGRAATLHRIADAAAQRKFRQRGRRRRTGQTDDDGQIECRASSSPIHARIGALSKQNCVDHIDMDARSGAPSRARPSSTLKTPGGCQIGMAFGMAGDAHAMSMPCASINPLAPTSRLELNGPLARATSPAISSTRPTSASPLAAPENRRAPRATAFRARRYAAPD